MAHDEMVVDETASWQNGIAPKHVLHHFRSHNMIKWEHDISLMHFYSTQKRRL
jgi:hypothetical protein